MKLHKALKLRKKLVGEINDLKIQIQSKNSFMEGSVNPENFSVQTMILDLMSKISTLVGLKYAINEGNREIQSQIYILSEYKALITFWKNVNVLEGKQVSGYGQQIVLNYIVQMDEKKRNELIESYQTKVDAIQEQIDTYNYTTEIPWDDKSEDEREFVSPKITGKE